MTTPNIFTKPHTYDHKTPNMSQIQPVGQLASFQTLLMIAATCYCRTTFTSSASVTKWTECSIQHLTNVCHLFPPKWQPEQNMSLSCVVTKCFLYKLELNLSASTVHVGSHLIRLQANRDCPRWLFHSNLICLLSYFSSVVHCHMSAEARATSELDYEQPLSVTHHLISSCWWGNVSLVWTPDVKVSLMALG